MRRSIFPLVVAAVLVAAGCKRPPPERDVRHQAALALALTAVEHSTGDERADARDKFSALGTALELRSRPEDEGLLPRFEALLASQDEADAWLGVMLVAGVAKPSSLPKLWAIINDDARSRSFRDYTIGTVAATYRDPQLLPLVRDRIDHSEDAPIDAMRALKYYATEPGVADYLRRLAKDPKRVTLALEVLKQSGTPYDPNAIAVAQHTYSNWGDGISLDFPEDWPSGEREGYSAVFSHAPSGSFYGYWEVKSKPPPDSARVLADIEQREHLKNELPPEQRTPAVSVWAKTGALHATQGLYTITREPERIRRIVVLGASDRAVVVSGEARKSKSEDFERVFPQMWPTLRIERPSPEAVDALTKAVQGARPLK